MGSKQPEGIKNLLVAFFISAPIFSSIKSRIPCAVGIAIRCEQNRGNLQPRPFSCLIFDSPESLKKLSEADVFIGICESYPWSGCRIERETVSEYGIKNYVVPASYVIDDYDALFDKLHPVCCNEASN